VLEEIEELIKLAKDHDVGSTGVFWLLAFGVIARFAGKAASGAMKYVTKLLDMSSKLREQMGDQLEEANDKLKRIESDLSREQGRTKALRAELDDALTKGRDLVDQINDTEARLTTTKATLTMRDGQLAELRKSIGAEQLGLTKGT
jgi:septal ring factor EnvC (AmiA/AmiB activator)